MFCGKVSFEQCFGSEAARIRIKKGRQDPDPHGKMRIRTILKGLQNKVNKKQQHMNNYKKRIFSGSAAD